MEEILLPRDYSSISLHANIFYQGSYLAFLIFFAEFFFSENKNKTVERLICGTQGILTYCSAINYLQKL